MESNQGQLWKLISAMLKCIDTNHGFYGTYSRAIWILFSFNHGIDSGVAQKVLNLFRGYKLIIALTQGLYKKSCNQSV